MFDQFLWIRNILHWTDCLFLFSTIRFLCKKQSIRSDEPGQSVMLCTHLTVFVILLLIVRMEVKWSATECPNRSTRRWWTSVPSSRPSRRVFVKTSKYPKPVWKSWSKWWRGSWPTSRYRQSASGRDWLLDCPGCPTDKRPCPSNRLSGNNV